jgi:hypothetical protein
MTRKKCFSSCRGHPEKECNAPRCKYINSGKTKYCRLSSKYKMKPPECRVTRKIKKTEIIPHAQKVIKRFVLKHRHNKESQTPKKSANKIAQFMRRTTQKRRALFLKTICEDSGVCIAFGKESQKISQFFNHFVEFDFVQPPIKRIGRSSMNGFVNEIQYKKYNYHAYAVLKSATKQKSDNLAYEYLVGRYINKKLTKFPCFLETYGLYMYVSNDKWTHVKDTKLIQTNVLKDSLILLDKFDISTACRNSKYLAILIQHIKNAETILSLTNYSENEPFIIRDLLGVLYQIYFPLSLMSSEFTHYDLHAENVLLYTPVKGKYIHYHYHINDNTVIEFRSPYIAKIIDYGRSYFKDEEDKKSSTELVDDLCKNRDCDPSCGNDYGFSWFDKDINENNYFLSAYHNNPSHDLRLLIIINYFIKSQKKQLKSLFPDIILNPLFDFLKKVKYGEGINDKTDKFFGTKPNRKSGYPKSINNVTDAEIGLRNILLMPENISMNETEYKIENKLGDLHVYADKNMLFIPYV